MPPARTPLTCLRVLCYLKSRRAILTRAHMVRAVEHALRASAEASRPWAVLPPEGTPDLLHTCLRPVLGTEAPEHIAIAPALTLRLPARAVAAAVRKRAAEGPRTAPPGAAVGPQHSPSLPSSKPAASAAAAPAPSRARPAGSEGDWAGRRRQEQAGRGAAREQH